MTLPDLDRICCFCGKRNDRHQPAPGNRERVPTAGAVLICAYCAEISIATETGTRMPNAAEMIEFRTDETVRSAQRFVKEQLMPRMAARQN